MEYELVSLRDLMGKLSAEVALLNVVDVNPDTTAYAAGLYVRMMATGQAVTNEDVRSLMDEWSTDIRTRFGRAGSGFSDS